MTQYNNALVHPNNLLNCFYPEQQHTIEDIAYGDSSEDDEQTHYASWKKQMASGERA